MSVIYIEGDALKHCGKVSTVPDGVEYWIVQPSDDVPESKEYRDAWEWNPTRPADGIGGEQ